MGISNQGLGFPQPGEHFEYHPREGWKISVPDGYRYDWDRDTFVPDQPPLSAHGEFLKRWHSGQTGWGSQ